LLTLVLIVNAGLPWGVVVLVILVCGLAMGLLNGLLVRKAKIDSFIATLGVGTLAYGLAGCLTGALLATALALPAKAQNMDELRARITKATAPVTTWDGPTTGPKAAPGKTVIYISADQRNGGLLYVTDTNAGLSILRYNGI
jgi:ABC-type xylose transport system permease subunit